MADSSEEKYNENHVVKSPNIDIYSLVPSQSSHTPHLLSGLTNGIKTLGMGTFGGVGKINTSLNRHDYSLY